MDTKVHPVFAEIEGELSAGWAVWLTEGAAYFIDAVGQTRKVMPKHKMMWDSTRQSTIIDMRYLWRVA